MMRAAAALMLIGALLLVSSWALAQSGIVPPTYTLEAGKTLNVAVDGATTAYALDGDVVRVSAQSGEVTLQAIAPGRTTVVAVTANGERDLIVVVTAPPQARVEGAESDRDGDVSESGTYAGNYDSTSGQFSNSFAFALRQGSTFRRLSFTNATYVSPSGGEHGTLFPLLSYEVGGPGYDVTFLDQSVTTSPLTFENALVRGLHVDDGDWSFHGGASTIAQFSNFFVPTNPQWTFGVTRRFHIRRNGVLSANLYDIVNSRGAQVSTPGGAIGSVMYAWQPQKHLSAYAEVGLSRSIGYAAAATYDDAKQHAALSVLEKPANFASLAVDAQQGLFSAFDYERTFSPRLSATATAQQSDYTLPSFRENSQTAQGSLAYRLSRVLTLNVGTLYSSFAAYTPSSFRSRTLALPIGLSYAGGPYTLGAQWQPTTDFAGTVANGFGANAGITQGRLQAGVYYSHNVDIPTVASIFSQVPGLQAALEAAGINVTDPSQLAALLNNAALLAKLGFSGLQIDLAPVQNTAGFNATWRLRRTQTLAASYLQSDSKLSQGSLNFRIASLTYTRHFGYGNEGTLGLTYLRTAQSVGGAPSVSAAPGIGITFRHRFSSVPSLLFPTRRGSIGGYVFRDDDARGAYAASMPGLAGVEVTLDGGRTTTTDARGHYSFAGVPYGPHTVAAQVRGTKPYAFTTDSPAVVSAGGTADFGISYTQGKLFGYVTDDAGIGIPGVLVQIEGLPTSATTGDDGRFTFNGVPPGHYVVRASPDSLPPGYDLATLTPATVDVRAAAPQPVALSVAALRSIAGAVSYYNPRTQSVAPAPGFVVTILELGRSTTTDGNGDYAFRELPAGTFTLEVRGGGAKARRTVTLSGAPTTLTGINFRVTSDQATRVRDAHRHGHSERG